MMKSRVRHGWGGLLLATSFLPGVASAAVWSSDSALWTEADGGESVHYIGKRQDPSPGKPTGVMAALETCNTAGFHRIRVSWTPPAAGTVASYEVHYALDGSTSYAPLENVGNVTQKLLALSVSQVGADPARITFKVKAGNADGEFGELSDTAGVVTRKPRKPSISLHQEVLAIDVEWRGMENPRVPRFDLFGSDDSDTRVLLQSITDGRRAYRDGGLGDHTRRHYQIRAHGPCYDDSDPDFAGDTTYSSVKRCQWASKAAHFRASKMAHSGPAPAEGA